jgi:arylformamidase
MAYGPRPRQRCDALPPLDPADRWPVLVWFHGGFWQERDRADGRFPWHGVAPHGWGLVAAGYTLAPDASLDEIIGECRGLLRWLRAELPEMGGDPGRIVVGGHSAGAHLAAMLLADRDLGPVLAGGVLVSGVYDLDPVRRSYVNDLVGMDEAAARRNSPTLLPPPAAPVLLVWGQRETPGFVAQSQALLAAWAAEALELPGRHHFDAPLELADPTSRSARAATSLPGAAAAR